MSICGCTTFIEPPAKQQQLILNVDQQLLDPVPPLITIQQFNQTQTEVQQDK